MRTCCKMLLINWMEVSQEIFLFESFCPELNDVSKSAPTAPKVSQMSTASAPDLNMFLLQKHIKIQDMTWTNVSNAQIQCNIWESTWLTSALNHSRWQNHLWPSPSGSNQSGTFSPSKPAHGLIWVIYGMELKQYR